MPDRNIRLQTESQPEGSGSKQQGHVTQFRSKQLDMQAQDLPDIQRGAAGRLPSGVEEERTDAIGANADSRVQNVMPCLGTLDDVRQLVTKHNVEEVVVALEDNEQNRVNEILRILATCGDIIIKIAPNSRDILVGNVKIDNIFHSPLLVINNRLMPEWQYSIKRMFDIVVSLLVMILLSPIYLITAIIVKCTSPGPVFYAQERVGYMGRPFRMIKFRSMYVDAESAGPALSKDDDPRMTPFGRFMRKVRLDEFPQFYNVLKGNMSIVGPRPERQYYIDQIVQRAPEYLLLQRLRPGITSWGQVKYGYASTVDEMRLDRGVVDEVKQGDVFSFKTDTPVKRGDKLYRVDTVIDEF